jgi:2-polyprenyl-3-methyl-5-hydroxy-6-metoxy-1,4-benzoquinol methylase
MSPPPHDENRSPRTLQPDLRYQVNFTGAAGAPSQMYDRARRESKAEKIIAVLRSHFGDLSRLRLLDLSSSTGFMANVFGRHFLEVVGIDIDDRALEHSRTHLSRDNVQFLKMDALNTSFETGSFDVAICNHMYEHVPDAAQLFREVHRILRPGGVCYFGGNNRLKIVEPHYGPMPFLSWLPKPLAHRYMRLMKKGSYYYETHFTFWTLKRLVADFVMHDYTLRVLADPAGFAATDLVAPNSLQQRLGLLVGRKAYWALPGYIWLLQKAR